MPRRLICGPWRIAMLWSAAVFILDSPWLWPENWPEADDLAAWFLYPQPIVVPLVAGLVHRSCRVAGAVFVMVTAAFVVAAPFFFILWIASGGWDAWPN